MIDDIYCYHGRYDFSRRRHDVAWLVTYHHGLTSRILPPGYRPPDAATDAFFIGHGILVSRYLQRLDYFGSHFCISAYSHFASQHFLAVADCRDILIAAYGMRWFHAGLRGY